MGFCDFRIRPFIRQFIGGITWSMAGDGANFAGGCYDTHIYHVEHKFHWGSCFRVFQTYLLRICVCVCQRTPKLTPPGRLSRPYQGPFTSPNARPRFMKCSPPYLGSKTSMLIKKLLFLVLDLNVFAEISEIWVDSHRPAALRKIESILVKRSNHSVSSSQNYSILHFWKLTWNAKKW